jgi:hypothetical protein
LIDPEPMKQNGQLSGNGDSRALFGVGATAFGQF